MPPRRTASWKLTRTSESSYLLRRASSRLVLNTKDTKDTEAPGKNFLFLFSVLSTRRKFHRCGCCALQSIAYGQHHQPADLEWQGRHRDRGDGGEDRDRPLHRLALRP